MSGFRNFSRGLTPMRGRKRGKKERDELVSLLFLALLFFVLLAGRELGSIYNGYGEISRLSVLFQLDEGELAGYVEGVLGGEDQVPDANRSNDLNPVKDSEPDQSPLHLRERDGHSTQAGFGRTDLYFVEDRPGGARHHGHIRIPVHPGGARGLQLQSRSQGRSHSGQIRLSKSPGG